MSRTLLLLLLSLAFCGFVCTACAQHPKLAEITDPAEAAKDRDFRIQGEYLGEGTWQGEANVKVGAQVIALGKSEVVGGIEFSVVVSKGGLPGDGWKRGAPRLSLSGTCNFVGMGERLADVALHGTQLDGQIAGDTMTITGTNGQATTLKLKRTVRHSPTEGAKAPEGGVVLFDGTTAEKFIDGTLLPDKNLLSNATSKQKFGDYTLHVEFRTSYMPEARGQARSNSGVYVHDCYEIQVLDSFGLEGKNDECGGFYSLREPDVNMCFPPLCWQTYDIDFTAPRYQDGKKIANAKIMVKHNGVVIHPEFELPHGTPGRQDEGPAPRPFYLQGHGNKVEYRNIWVKEK
jgi:hypothetical protein